jgi:hypothetical protein
MTIARNAFGSAAIWAIPQGTGAVLAVRVKTAAPRRQIADDHRHVGLAVLLILAATPDALKPTGRLVRRDFGCDFLGCGHFSFEVSVVGARAQA